MFKSKLPGLSLVLSTAMIVLLQWATPVAIAGLSPNAAVTVMVRTL
ncbi:MAG: hypothetical protein KKB37_15655 [Alphaproteobacteria bacterium]|nr:hypothetical protein [Alphaproteobacteria bacterium]